MGDPDHPLMGGNNEDTPAPMGVDVRGNRTRSEEQHMSEEEEQQ